ncbi:hypothetical protein IMZ31_22640 (plasmid) [Pontibacillus sp. ALD_SL1]|uniref:hypothetical protein n=1 Tax=Pontibacillus sp. ALD_SL1 TaxID=2777185 RepID=UPI001A96BD68|nr:hypothetical protein [Pontibacillus sp. ALD_SL1]QST02255.1 hypothetical protein IMZ31_22640 [Pontibacillus sp. ALD_SL1]
MKKELRNKILEENKYSDLLNQNPQYRLQGSRNKKVIVGVIKGDPENYNEGLHHLNFKSFNSWKEAYHYLEG